MIQTILKKTSTYSFTGALVLSGILVPGLLSRGKAHAFGLRRSPISATPSPSSAPLPTPLPSPAPVAEGCRSNDPEFQCIGLKMVAYLDDAGTPVIGEAESRTLVAEMNSVWSACKIGFQLENYLAVNPTSLGLQYNPYWQSEAGTVRAAFSDPRTFLVVAVGTLSSSTIAVTQMPYSSPYGTLVEKDFARNALTVGHELGHYMGLYHYRSTLNLMNPYIGPETQALTPDQCATARSTNAQTWINMMR